MELEAVFEIQRQCARLEAACYAVTLTNNPAPALLDRLAEEVLAMNALTTPDQP